MTQDNQEADRKAAEEAFKRAFEKAKGDPKKARVLFAAEAKKDEAILRACLSNWLEDNYPQVQTELIAEGKLPPRNN